MRRWLEGIKGFLLGFVVGPLFGLLEAVYDGTQHGVIEKIGGWSHHLETGLLLGVAAGIVFGFIGFVVFAAMHRAGAGRSQPDGA